MGGGVETDERMKAAERGCFNIATPRLDGLD